MCGCGGKKFSQTPTQRTGTTVSTSAQRASVVTSPQTLIQSSGATFGRLPKIQPIQRKTV